MVQLQWEGHAVDSDGSDQVPMLIGHQTEGLRTFRGSADGGFVLILLLSSRKTAHQTKNLDYCAQIPHPIRDYRA